MRAIKLTMSAFGPFADRQVIEFDKLGTNGLYLITGNTGAGKTTVFDAITYALFGSSSGGNRENSMIRSKYADDHTMTEVELVFAYRQNTYTIKRYPTQKALKKNKTDEFKEMRGGAELTLPDGTVFTKEKEIDARIHDIIGIDKEQFCQIAMIAQGAFLDLLLAKTSERQLIFRDLFKTEIFNDFQSRLSSEDSSAAVRVNELKNSIIQYMNGIMAPDEMAEDENVIKLRMGELPAAETMLLIEKLIGDDTDKAAVISTELDANSKRSEELTKIITKAEKQAEINSELEKTEKKRAELSERLSTLSEENEKQKKNIPLCDELSKEISLAEAELSEHNLLDEKVREAADTEKKITSEKEKLELIQKKTENTKSEIGQIKEEQKGLQDAGEKKNDLVHARDELQNKMTDLSKLVKELDSLDEARLRHKQAADRYRKAEIDADEAETNAKAKRRSFSHDQAGIMAEDLEEGSPCPVCGSCSHPKKACKSEDAPSQAEVEAAEAASDTAKETERIMFSEAEKRHAEVIALENAVSEHISALIGECEIADAKTAADAMTKNLNGRLDEITKQINAADKAISRRNELDRLIPEKEHELEKCSEEMTVTRENITALTTAAAEKKKQCDELKAKLRFADRTEAENALNELNEKLSALKNAIEKADKEFRECERESRDLTVKAEQLRNMLEDSGETDIDASKAEKEALADRKAVLDSEMESIKIRINSNTNAKQHIEERNSELSEAEKRFSWIHSLFLTACGKMKDKDKVSLETYIQMSYLDRITHRANIHLMKMSGGQYELERQETADNHKGSSGLELSVTDHYNGSKRSVKTLSGGESFIASLSLALGLSEEIQASASGGIQLDSMFVDEGFGTLDEETLRLAMKALNTLSESSRLIGIISHVPELRQSIAKQIVVKKEKSGGSRAAIEFK